MRNQVLLYRLIETQPQPFLLTRIPLDVNGVEAAVVLAPGRFAVSHKFHRIGATMDGRTFREAFVRTIMLEISQPERTVNDDLLRGFQAGFDAANGPREMIFVEDNAARIAELVRRAGGSIVQRRAGVPLS